MLSLWGVGPLHVVFVLGHLFKFLLDVFDVV
jgi:hypothetical protein